MITIDINKRKNKLYFSNHKNGGSIKNIFWFYVAQAFLLYIHNYLGAFPFTKKKLRSLLMNKNYKKKIPFHSTIEDFTPSTVLH